jgi:hypothetical protein
VRRAAVAVALVLAVAAVAGCGVQPSGVRDAGRAPTGVAPGVTLYFVDADGRLRPQLRAIGHLGTVTEALAWLLSSPGSDGLHTEIKASAVDRVVASTTPGVISLRVPLTSDDVTARGIDQIVCTALGAHVQAGGSARDRVQILFTVAPAASARLRTCPVIG